MRDRLHALVVALVLQAAAPAAVADMYITIDGVVGDYVSAPVPGAIQVLSYNIGHDWATSSSRATFKPLQITKKIDVSSPTLAAMAATGQTIKSVTLSVRAPSAALNYPIFHTIVLRDASIRGFNASSSSDSLITELVTLYYNRIEWSYVPIDAAGRAGTPVTVRWDAVNNRFY